MTIGVAKEDEGDLRGGVDLGHQRQARGLVAGIRARLEGVAGERQDERVADGAVVGTRLRKGIAAVGDRGSKEVHHQIVTVVVDYRAGVAAGERAVLEGHAQV